MAYNALEAYHTMVRELTAPNAPFALTEVEIGGQKYRAYNNMHRNVAALLKEFVRNNRDAAMYECEGVRRSYGEVFQDAIRLGAALKSRGVKSGDRVGIAMRNMPEWFTAYIAAARIGAVVALLNSRAAPREMTAAADKVGCRIIIADNRSAERLRDGGSKADIITVGHMSALIVQGGFDETSVDADPDAAAAIIFTSGTSGRPKGVTLTQRNICSMAAHLAFTAEVGIGMAAVQSGICDEIVRQHMPVLSLMMIFPMFHISGITNLMLAAHSGGMMTFLRRWDAAEAARLIEKNKVTTLSGPSLVFSDLLDQPEAAARLRSLQTIAVGGQATPPSLRSRISVELPHVTVGGGWGTTECSGSVTFGAASMLRDAPDSVGIPIPIADFKVVDADGNLLPAGAIGEFWVRGVNVMQGYWNEPAANTESFQDEWYKTGDVGYIDDRGFVFITDRKKDMIISAGENIYSAEVERVLASSQDHSEVALIGVPDARMGERAIAVIRLRPGSQADAASVKALVAAQLADYKVPAEVVFDLGKLPRNPIGKVDKAALRKLYFRRTAGEGPEGGSG